DVPYVLGRSRGPGRPPITTPRPLPPIITPRRSPPIMTPWPLPRIPPGRRRRLVDPQVTSQFPRESQDEYSRATQYLRDLAARSGARLYHAETLGNLKSAFSLIAEELRHQYALSYYPTNEAHDGAYRRVHVMVNQPNVVVRAREGYRAAGP